MDLSRLIQMLQEERGGQSGLRPISLLRALKQMISQGSRTRRNSGVQALDRPESLEVRQVLSAISPVDDSAPLIAVEESFIGDPSENQGLVAADQWEEQIKPRIDQLHSDIDLVNEQLDQLDKAKRKIKKS